VTKIEFEPAAKAEVVEAKVESVPAPGPSTSAIAVAKPLTIESPSPRVPDECEPSLTPARMHATKSKAVIVDIPLEVASIKFSSALRITAIRARPCSPAVSLRVDSRAFPGMPVTEIAFQIAHVNLDERG